MMLRRVLVAATAGMLISTPPLAADPPKHHASIPPDVAADARKALDKALGYLKSAQDKDGGWTTQYGPAVTAIVARGFARHPDYGPKHPIVKRSVESILRYQQEDGGIYDQRMNLANYQTAVALMLLASLDDPELKPRILKAQKMLTTLQYDDAESVDARNPWYGGAGYNTKKRPDLSNTQMMIEALHESGLSKDDPVYQRAVQFVSRCQMLGSTNDLPFAHGATDGGFIYSPADGGESKAEVPTDEGTGPLRSYGSMTYAGFKSLLFANVSKDDRRVRAAFEWIRKHYTLDENPNMPGKQAKEGLYYYYNVFAKALQAWGQPVITDARLKPHNWRTDLCKKLIALQKPDGSWVNDQPRWLEGDANYVTGLTVLTLQTALEP